MRAHGSVKSSDVVIGRDVCELFPLLLARISKKPFVTDLGGFMFPQLASGGSRGIVSLLRILPIAILEMVTLRLSSHVIVSCSEDEMNLRRIFKLDAARIDVVENGVDFAEFLPRKENRKNIRAKLGVRGKDLLVVFVGNLMAPHNFTAAKFIVKGLAPATESRVHFLIVGPHGDLPPEWQRSDRVRFTGFVPSVAPYVNASDICIAPLFSGAGMKTKTLAYLACGKPILMTKEAATGLALVDGRDAVICDMGSMPGLLTHLAVNGRLRLQLGMNAFAAGRKLDWSLRAAKFRNVLEKVVIMTHACNPTSDIKHSSHTAECDVDGQV
jgi:glycosyltransferase involved in cell wall biosynthesis